MKLLQSSYLRRIFDATVLVTIIGAIAAAAYKFGGVENDVNILKSEVSGMRESKDGFASEKFSAINAELKNLHERVNNVDLKVATVYVVFTPHKPGPAPSLRDTTQQELAKLGIEEYKPIHVNGDGIEQILEPSYGRKVEAITYAPLGGFHLKQYQYIHVVAEGNKVKVKARLRGGEQPTDLILPLTIIYRA